MCLQTNKSLLLLISFMLIFGGNSVLANEAPPAHEAPKEGAGGAEGEAKPAAGKKEKKEEGWQEVSARVQGLKAKADNHEKQIEHLVAEKNHTHDEARLSHIIKELVVEHKAYAEASKEYDKERAFLMYRFPEKGVKGDRSYERSEIKSLEDMENQMSLDGRVKSVLVKVRKQYPVVLSPEEAAAQKSKRKKGSHGEAFSEEDENLSSPVIFSK